MSISATHVGILGGGLQGCCAALALAERGARVTIFDRNDALLTRTAVANEGKIHLGYMYAGDPSLLTARMMMKGALSFAPFFARHFGLSLDSLSTSTPSTYVVHRDSQQTPEAIAHYLAKVHDLVVDAANGTPQSYFGIDLAAAPRMWSQARRDSVFNPDHIAAAFDTPEVAINPAELGQMLRACIAAHARIETATGHNVTGVDVEGEGVCVRTEANGGPSRHRFDHVVNALWDGRLALDAKLGLTAGKSWLHRLKYGVNFRLPTGASLPQSATFVLGPFGEIVSFLSGLMYLTWYPECMHGLSRDVTPPNWATYPDEPLRSRIVAGTLGAISEMMPSLRDLKPDILPDLSVKGGTIVARGETDIYDPDSLLHRRYEIGLTSTGRYHSVDPGKLTMAPYFSEILAERISGAV